MKFLFPAQWREQCDINSVLKSNKIVLKIIYNPLTEIHLKHCHITAEIDFGNSSINLHIQRGVKLCDKLILLSYFTIFQLSREEVSTLW